MVDDSPVQEIQPMRGMDLSCVNLEDLASDEREREAERLIRSETRRPFDLATGPMLRGVLIRMGGADHLLSIYVHHIVADGFSLGVFAHELSVLYQAYSSGQPSPLKPLPLQFTDFARWERERLSGSNLDRQLQFWREQLLDSPALRLPSDDTARESEPGQGGDEEFTVDGATSEALLEYAREAGVSSFMLLLAIFGVFLYRYSGLRDIVLGTVVQNRRRPGLEGVIGFFNNLLPLRIAVHPEWRFRDHVLAVRDMCLRAYAHQEASFERIVEELKLGRSGMRHPLTEVIFTTALERTVIQLGGLKIKWVHSDAGLSHSDFFFVMRRTDRGLAGRIQYKTERYAPSTISRMVQHWQTLLKSVAAKPNVRIIDLHVLSEAEQWEIAQGRNSTDRDYPSHLSAADLFEMVAKRSPDLLAIKCGETYITYGELDRRSSQVARNLREVGADAEVTVGLCFERSIGLVVGMLGVMKAGGAYVPIDPDHPAKRSAFIVSDSGIRLLLTSAALRPQAERLGVAKCFTLEDLERESPSHADLAPSLAKPDSAAYILYTSGSTGTPKGVAVTRRSLTNFLTGLAELFEMLHDHL